MYVAIETPECSNCSYGETRSLLTGEGDRYYSRSRTHRTENIAEGTAISYRGEEMGWGEQPSREDDQEALGAKAAWRKKRGFRDAFSAHMIQEETPASKAARTTGGECLDKYPPELQVFKDLAVTFQKPRMKRQGFRALFEFLSSP